MLRLLLAFIISCTFALESKAQINLVPNPSFEEYSQCPDPATVNPMPNAWIELATGWVNPTEFSPDYFNACANTNAPDFGVPHNNRGIQNARTGVAYAGLISMIETDAREYIQTKLTDSLIAGRQYLVTFYVSLAENSPYASNNMAAYFSNTPVSSSGNLNVLPYSPQISNNPLLNPLTDTTAWIEVSGVLTAGGGEKYITIGNFNDDASTDTTHLYQGLNSRSYHYIDDVSVICLDCTVGIVETDIRDLITVFPNPASDFLNINFNNSYPENIAMMNGIGLPVFVRNKPPNNFRMDISQYNSGIYFLKIETKDFSITKQFLINH